ncbi:hypothetical protein EYF80_061567 [Liparis tanakae]|uniref:Uncharacterized protein n=1 Tax=Liparis tanakae TaxID=230148 RepID=A0A4Z2EHQ1_9TELE|nr:hypothetical protein EYF80_061567 [Liparis tanakae]
MEAKRKRNAPYRRSDDSWASWSCDSVVIRPLGVAFDGVLNSKAPSGDARRRPGRVTLPGRPGGGAMLCKFDVAGNKAVSRSKSEPGRLHLTCSRSTANEHGGAFLTSARVALGFAPFRRLPTQRAGGSRRRDGGMPPDLSERSVSAGRPGAAERPTS